MLPLFCTEDYVTAPRRLWNPVRLRSLHAENKRNQEGGDYVLDGIKCNVPFAAESDWMLAYAACEGKSEAFLIPKGTAGLKVGRREQNMGLRALPLYAVELKECRIPASQRLGEKRDAIFPSC